MSFRYSNALRPDPVYRQRSAELTLIMQIQRHRTPPLIHDESGAHTLSAIVEWFITRISHEFAKA